MVARVVLNAQISKYMMLEINSSRDFSYNAVGKYDQQLPCLTNPNKLADCLVTLSFLIEDGVICEAREDVFGEPVAKAAGRWLIYKAKNRTVGEALGLITPAAMSEELEVPKSSVLFTRCESVYKAFFAALEKYPI